jgi:hypothetical protein
MHGYAQSKGNRQTATFLAGILLAGGLYILLGYFAVVAAIAVGLRIEYLQLPDVDVECSTIESKSMNVGCRYRF